MGNSTARVCDVAQEALSCGISVLAVAADGTKAPALREWKWLTSKRATPAQVAKWYVETPDAGLGLIGGPVSGGLEFIDLDDPTLARQLGRRAAETGLAELLERIGRGWRELTPNGAHLAYRCSETSGNRKLARRVKRPDEMEHPNDRIKVLIETRGAGGYVISWPSSGQVHPSGRPYGPMQGSFQTIATITPEEREALFALCRTFDELPRTVYGGTPASRLANGDGARPGDDFNARASWADVLVGWTALFTRDGLTYWRRPGKSDRGWSATTGVRGSDGMDVLYVFSTATVFESEKGYTKFGAYALLEHGGDFVAAARELSQQRRTAAIPTHARANQANQENRDTSGLRLTLLSDLLAEPEVEHEWVVEGRLLRAGLSLLAAKPKVGKSTLARNIALSVASGDSFMASSTIQGPVVYLALEDKRSEVAKHFRRMGATNEAVFVHTGAAPEEALAELAAAIAEHAAVLAIIDPLLKLIRLRDANDYAEVTRSLEPVLELARRSGCHLCGTHHTGKGERAGGDAVLGSTALFGAVDTLILLKRRLTDNIRTVETIQRYGEDLVETVVALDPVTGLTTPAGEVAAIQLEQAGDAVLDALGDELLTEHDIRVRVGGNESLLAKAIRALHAQDKLVRSGAGKRGDPYVYARFSRLDIYGNRETEQTEKQSELLASVLPWR